ncbi:hypothetical protein ASG40_11075 [Methylobacterium sp. Leaf399]|uniref:type II toxin-antitoxin system VapB family antitoxin n=1 Tax=Methylobacterium sp. Leaf399 TaxID=1736364 RepID=UPI0007005A17|nr:type II toxin-antitoxin system VapB family antitoxin [Methylobacterium sp. Leaf399]KQT09175.1 hypothetical protein ASG40_11075 [Methylobacterium sp. Leaf399]
MTETLIVEGDEAYALAQELADRRGTSLGEAVVASLRASLDERSQPSAPDHARGPFRIPTVEEMTPEQRDDYEALRALVRETSRHIAPGATSDHSSFYDDSGLPI